MIDHHLFGHERSRDRETIAFILMQGVTVDELAGLIDKTADEITALRDESRRFGEWDLIAEYTAQQRVLRAREMGQVRRDAAGWAPPQTPEEAAERISELLAHGMPHGEVAELVGCRPIDVFRVGMFHLYGPPTLPSQRDGGRGRASGTPSATTRSRSRRGPTRKRSR